MRVNDTFQEQPAARWQPLGSLESLHIRVGKEAAPRPVATAQAIAGFGLVGDRHASPRSPRQLLLAGSEAYQRWGLPALALRENLLVDFSTAQLSSGDLVRVGNEVILWMTFLCEPCSLLERRCPGTLKTIGAHRGMLARVVRAGTLRPGDEVAVCRARAPVFSADWQGRVLQVARAVPENFRISHRQLAELAGVHTAYCRAFPRVLSRLPAELAGRVGSEPTGMPQWSGAELFDIEALHLG
ncbi:MAG: MOSC domain-containing protein [Comamonas sp.]